MDEGETHAFPLGLSHPGNCFSLTFKIVHSEVVYKCMKKKVS
jgi:hypothetical protein